MNAKEISSTECIAIFFRLLNASDDVNCRTVSVPSRHTETLDARLLMGD